MKKFTIICLLLVGSYHSFAVKDWCDKRFLKNKSGNKKSEIFKDEPITQTVLMPFFKDGSRQLFIGFKRTDADKVVIYQYTATTLSFKQPFVLGSGIRIGVLFQNKESYIITFTGNAVTQEISGPISSVYSSAESNIEARFDSLLKVSRIDKVEIQNPFGAVNQSMIRSSIVRPNDADEIKNTYQCFLNRKVETENAKAK